MTTQKYAPWPSDWPRPKGLRAVARLRADGSAAWDWYCRQTGARLPDPMADPPSFIRAVAAARQPAPQWQAGTIGDALVQWRRSPEYKGLGERTRWSRDHYTQPLDALSSRQLVSLKRADVLALRDAMAEGSGPAAANALSQSVSSFLSWCLDRGLVEYNCAARIGALPTGHFPAWTEAEAAALLEAVPEHIRRAVLMAYHLGQRRGDLINLTWAAYDQVAGIITLQPEKTSKVREARQVPPLRLPVHPDLRAELDAWKEENRNHAKPTLTILATVERKTWGRNYLSNQVKFWVDKLGLRPGLNMHGFRKLAAIRLAEAGATTSEIAAAIGWDSLRHVELYTKAASQERLARAAVVRLQRPVSHEVSQTGTNARKTK